jgi:hypothetical protein
MAPNIAGIDQYMPQRNDPFDPYRTGRLFYPQKYGSPSPAPSPAAKPKTYDDMPAGQKYADMAKLFGDSFGGGGFKNYDPSAEAFEALARKPFGGRSIPGSTTRLAGGLTMSTPRAFEPIVTPGVGGGYQGKSTGQRFAGAAMGGLQGAATGAAIGAAGGPIGAGAGALIGALGGFFS